MVEERTWAAMIGDIGGLKADVGGVKKDVADLKTEIAGMRDDFESGLEKIGDKLDALEVSMATTRGRSSMLRDVKRAIWAGLAVIIGALASYFSGAGSWIGRHLP